jgi:hypothetical protein
MRAFWRLRAGNRLVLLRRILACGVAAVIVAHAGPAPRIVVRQRPMYKGAAKLEKRCREALKTAGAALMAARAEYRAGNSMGMRANTVRVEQSIDLAYRSLAGTGKNAREEPKHFKRAEIEIHDLYRRVEFLQMEMSFDDRAELERLKTRLRQVQDSLLRALMNGSTIGPVQTASAQ